MSSITFADIVHQSITFSTEDEAEALVLKLIDTSWVQRLRDISQTANTRLVYMFSEHSRFGHSLGVAYLAKQLLAKLARDHEKIITAWRAPVICAALLHDIGHLAPGSHTAFKTWFPNLPDAHEAVGIKILTGSEEIRSLLSAFDRELPLKVQQVLQGDPSIPAWTWQILSGGGWNVDRGNWCTVDSVMAGVAYGQYNIPALIDSLTITDSGQLALLENRLDAMVHFMVSRHAMYRQIYQHRVLLASDMLNRSLVLRARDLAAKLSFADPVMETVLSSTSHEALSLETIFQMREAWWRYHLLRWLSDPDPIVRDLSDRLINRKLFKTVRLTGADIKAAAVTACEKSGLDTSYYLHEISNADVHKSDSGQSILVALENGRFIPLSEADPIFSAMSSVVKRSWLAMPSEIKQLIGNQPALANMNRT